MYTCPKKPITALCYNSKKISGTTYLHEKSYRHNGASNRQVETLQGQNLSIKASIQSHLNYFLKKEPKYETFTIQKFRKENMSNFSSDKDLE